jgi:uncharacterized membrane protein YqjE
VNQTMHTGSNGRPLTDLLGEVKDEAEEFLATRLQMLVSEMHENYVNSKSAVIYGLAAATLLLTGYLLLTLALVVLIAQAFPNNPYAWFFALLIVGLLWSIVGGILAISAKEQYRGLAPRRTLKVLKEDKALLESEVENPA